uniref:Centromere protein X n=1 Tax=Mus spicilegus TaxID=10103 RepID=A0A8C6I4S2_MUSSI
MEENSGFRKELVSRLLHLHFRDCKTKGLGHQWGGEYVGHREGGCPMTPPPSPFPPVSGDALQLMAEFLRIFVLEAAVRGVWQAQAEDLDVVEVDQLEKVLPQLLLDF